MAQTAPSLHTLTGDAIGAYPSPNSDYVHLAATYPNDALPSVIRISAQRQSSPVVGGAELGCSTPSSSRLSNKASPTTQTSALDSPLTNRRQLPLLGLAFGFFSMQRREHCGCCAEGTRATTILHDGLKAELLQAPTPLRSSPSHPLCPLRPVTPPPAARLQPCPPGLY